MKIVLVSSLLLTAVFFMSSCHNTKPAAIAFVAEAGGSEMLYQSEWKLTEVEGKTVGSASKASIALTPGQVNKVSGNSGCNRMTGSFELTGTNNIKFSPLATTRMACMDDIANDTEKKFLDALSQATNWSIKNNQLLLKNGEIVVAKLQAQKPPTKEELQLNGTWELNYISGAKIAFNGMFPDKKPLLVFDFPKPEVSGNGGCNGYSAKVKVEANKITFGDPLSTMMFCEGNGEPVYFKTLKKVTSYNISDNNILNLVMGDIAVLRFTRK